MCEWGNGGSRSKVTTRDGVGRKGRVLSKKEGGMVDEGGTLTRNRPDDSRDSNRHRGDEGRKRR